MATSMEKHVRLRIFFENAKISPSWLLVELNTVENIKELKNLVCERFLKTHKELELTLQDCILPENERSVILRDDDGVYVRIIKKSREHKSDNKSVAAEAQEGCVTDQGHFDKKHKHKKAKKHKIENVENNVVADEPCNRKQKEKRKYRESEEERDEQDQSICELSSSKKPKLSKTKEMQKRNDTETVTRSESEETPTKGGDVTISKATEETGVSGKDKENDVTVSKQRRKRKRKRNKKNVEDAKQRVPSVDMSVENLKNSVSSFRDTSFNRGQSARRNGGKIRNSTPTNNHTLFSSSSSSDEEKEPEVSHDGFTEEHKTCSSNETNIFFETESGKNKELEIMKQKLLSQVQELEYHSNSDRESLMLESGDVSNVPDQQDKNSDRSSDNMSVVSQKYGTDENTTGVPVKEVWSTVNTSVLPNGVPVFSRQRRRPQHPRVQGLSKQQQLNTKLTNRSFILKGSIASGDSSDQSENVQSETNRFDGINSNEQKTVECVEKDYTKFSLLQGTPRSGDTIAYKVLEMSETYTPEVSSYKEGVVVNFDHSSQTVNIQVKQGLTERMTNGKFDVVLEDDDIMLTNVLAAEDQVTLSWSSLLETRLLS